ncbi:MAG: hypothetical protein IJ217_02445 [Clostridia bacterium]|nr:hypothetical protein [Clostridia bacterium]
MSNVTGFRGGETGERFTYRMANGWTAGVVRLDDGRILLQAENENGTSVDTLVENERELEKLLKLLTDELKFPT